MSESTAFLMGASRASYSADERDRCAPERHGRPSDPLQEQGHLVLRTLERNGLVEQRV